MAPVAQRHATAPARAAWVAAAAHGEPARSRRHHPCPRPLPRFQQHPERTVLDQLQTSSRASRQARPRLAVPITQVKARPVRQHRPAAGDGRGSKLDHPPARPGRSPRGPSAAPQPGQFLPLAAPGVAETLVCLQAPVSLPGPRSCVEHLFCRTVTQAWGAPGATEPGTAAGAGRCRDGPCGLGGWGQVPSAPSFGWMRRPWRGSRRSSDSDGST